MTSFSDSPTPPTFPNCVTVGQIQSDLESLLRNFQKALLDSEKTKLDSTTEIKKIVRDINSFVRCSAGISVRQAIEQSLGKGSLTQAGTIYIEPKMRLVANHNPYMLSCTIVPSDARAMDLKIVEKSREIWVACKSGVNWGNADQHAYLEQHFLKTEATHRTKSTTNAERRYLLLIDDGETLPRRKSIKQPKGSRQQDLDYFTLSGPSCYYYLSGGNPDLSRQMNECIFNFPADDFLQEREEIRSSSFKRHGIPYLPSSQTESPGTSWIKWSPGPSNLLRAWKKVDCRKDLQNLMGHWWAIGTRR